MCGSVPPNDIALKKTVQIKFLDLETINLIQFLCLMSFWGHGIKSQYLEAFVYILKPYFILISKCLPYQGGILRLIKSLPSAENLFLSSTDDIFVICNI